jgi:hypothetical protein
MAKTTKKSKAKKNGKPAAKPSGAYRLTSKELPPETGGQRRAVHDAIKAGATDAAAVREAVRGTAAFKGASDTTLRNNVNWYLTRLRRDGFISKGGKQ